MKKRRFSLLTYILPILIIAALEFLYNRATPFIMDDLWYQTNLSNGQPLAGIKDVAQGQIWHYFNWGGRTITHTILQLSLMGGELFCDILNMIMTFMLALVISSFAKEKSNRIFFFGAAFSLIISFNISINYNMFWQSGAANYLYASVWILAFLSLYFRELNFENPKPLKGVNYWIIPLGLITGWSNENMGPACFILSILVIIACMKKKKYKKVPWWMTLGCISSLIGSALLILAPGNFVRSSIKSDSGLVESLMLRLSSLLEGIGSFLLPAFLCSVFLFIILVFVLRLKAQESDIILIVTAVLAFDAMILSPHFPPRAAFGIMVLLIVLILSLMEQICRQFPAFQKVCDLFLISSYVYSIIKLTICVSYFY